MESKELLIKELASNIHQLDNELEVIDLNVLIQKSTLDLLCVDSTGRLFVVEADIKENDMLIFKTLDHYDWILSNMGILKNKYGSSKIDFTLAPEIIIISKEFSEYFQKRISYLNKVKINLYKYSWDEEDSQIIINPMTFKIKNEEKKESKKEKSPEQILNDIYNEKVRNKCRQFISYIEKLKTGLKIDTSEGIIKFLDGEKYFAGIYVFERFFWVNFNPDYWQGEKIDENTELDFKTFLNNNN